MFDNFDLQLNCLLSKYLPNRTMLTYIHAWNHLAETLYLLIGSMLVLNRSSVVSATHQAMSSKEYADYYDNEYSDSGAYISNYMSDSGLTPEEEVENQELLDSLLDPPVQARAGTRACDSLCSSCLLSCNHLKRTRAVTASQLVQYLYLMVCAKGCRYLIPCLTDKYCLPVMRENPDFFVQCGNRLSVWLRSQAIHYVVWLQPIVVRCFPSYRRSVITSFLTQYYWLI